MKRPTARSNPIETAWALAKQRYASIGVDTDQALATLETIPISLHCWQGDDVGGFEGARAVLGGGLAITGNYPGKARTPDELRADLEQALRLIPGRHRVNLHASYAECAGKVVERDDIGPEHFENWIDWARSQKIGLDFNPTFFGHRHAADGFTLAHHDKGIRQFWINHGIRSRTIGAAFGKALGSACVTNVWIPDGYKDMPVDRNGPRERLSESLDAVFQTSFPVEHNLDAVESKLFGIGSECYVVGSHEFYLGYAITRKKLLCLDTGHFHPTEEIADKISAVLNFLPGLLLHVSRGVRWDSDHVVTLTDPLEAIAQEVVRGDFLTRIHIGLDYFDASINRIAAWVIGARNVLRSLLAALLEPKIKLRKLEAEGDLTARLTWLEELKTFPVGSVWDYYCLRQGVPIATGWLKDVRRYENKVLCSR